MQKVDCQRIGQRVAIHTAEDRRYGKAVTASVIGQATYIGVQKSTPLASDWNITRYRKRKIRSKET